MVRTLTRSLVRRRQKKSKDFSQTGFTRYTVGFPLQSIGITAYLYIVLAESDWRLYTTTPLSPTPATTARNNTSNTTSPEASVIQPGSTSSQLAALDGPGGPTHSDVTPDQLDATSARPTQPFSQPSSTTDQPDTENSHLGEVLPQLDASHSLVASATLEADPGPAPLSPTPSLPQADELALLSLLNSSPSIEAALPTINIPPPEPLAGVTAAPAWMKKKRTLDYFRGTFKLGCLSDIIQHWYELEGLLGFPETVSLTS